MDYYKNLVPSQLIAERGSDIVVINPGSEMVRIGLASWPAPVTVPHCLAHRMNSPMDEQALRFKTNCEQVYRKPLSPLQQQEREEAYKEIESELRVQSPNHDSQKQFCLNKGDYIDGYNSQRRSYEDQTNPWTRAKENKSNVLPKSENANKCGEEDCIIEIEDDNNTLRTIIYGEEAMRISPSQPYIMRRPIRRGHFNISQFYCMQQILEDIYRIWDWILKEKCNLPLENRRKVSAVLVLSESFDVREIKEMVSVILRDLQFEYVVVHQEWSLGDLTLGIYLLSLQHASEMAVDNLEGEQIFSDFMIQDLIYHVELAKGAYLKDAAALARNSMLRESHVLKFVTNSNLMRPGYYIGVDPRSKLVILGIRGTHTVHDIITDMISTSSHEASFDGFRVHFGTAEAARWFFRHELQTLKVCLEKHQGFKLRLVGHSLGGAAAALLAIMIRRRSEEELGFSPHIVSAVGFATPPCVPKSLAESCQDFVTTVVLQDDAIPRMSASNLAKLRNEILHTDWTRLLESEKGRSVADIITNTIQVLSSVQDAARKYAAYAKFGNSSEGDLNKSNNRKNANTINQSAEPPANMDVPVSSTLKGIKSTHEDLFAPGTLYHIRGRCVTLTGKKVTSGKENCTLWKCNPKEYFRRIVLSRTMLSDHKCDSHYYALRDVLKGLPSSDNKSLT